MKREWSIKDYYEQLEFWLEIPPPNISLWLLAQSHGAKLGGGAKPHMAAELPPADNNVDPEALAGALGVQGIGTYQAPQLGLSLGTEGQVSDAGE